ncbi:alpha-L-fucosidase [Clostridium sulfidigenes]|uniref:alpha-L-fucosidase n=1 Tax=Clostridium sulfidigenes TaxID=318464 RepID=A0A084J8K0_9CLOT|nr:alpha-L-fucosidase [Clostridium sulfidigenes]KEZ85284.1 alpha-L-fucosidase [Clostridium sulfidigenes]
MIDIENESKIYLQREERTKWFQEARFGMFIHWGLYSIPAAGEWIMTNRQMTVEEYKPYFAEFNPTKYNPRQWAKLAKKAGMKYAVMTAKHHDGFCLFDSAYTDYKSTNTKAGRDLIKEYIDAFRTEDIKIGLYYSLLDWHHEDYPAYGDRHHPMRNNTAFKNKIHNFDNYVKYFHNQVKELVTGYGKIDIMWFDFSYDNMTGEKWKATELVDMIRKYQPDIIIDNRLDDKKSIKKANLSPYTGDFDSPEQIIPPKGVLNENRNPVPWEACITLNNNWGYASMDKDYKSSKQVVRSLVECVSKNGNMILNVGPNAKGEIPKESVAILEEVGEWLDDNGDSIYGCKGSYLPKPEWGRYTQNGNLLYAHIYDRGIGHTNLNNLRGKIKKARLLKDCSEIKVEFPWMAEEFEADAFILLPGAILPDEKDTVVELELL